VIAGFFYSSSTNGGLIVPTVAATVAATVSAVFSGVLRMWESGGNNNAPVLKSKHRSLATSAHWTGF